MSELINYMDYRVPAWAIQRGDIIEFDQDNVVVESVFSMIPKSVTVEMRLYGDPNKTPLSLSMPAKFELQIFREVEDSKAPTPETIESARENLLAKAKAVVCTDRNQQYGGPEKSFAKIARLWSAYLDFDVSATDVAMLMGLLKIARISVNQTHEDSFIDLAGYAACGWETAK